MHIQDRTPLTRLVMCFLLLLFFLQWRFETQAAADRSHMLPRRSALQRCQASLKE